MVHGHATYLIICGRSSSVSPISKCTFSNSCGELSGEDLNALKQNFSVDAATAAAMKASALETSYGASCVLFTLWNSGIEFSFLIHLPFYILLLLFLCSNGFVSSTHRQEPQSAECDIWGYRHTQCGWFTSFRCWHRIPALQFGLPTSSGIFTVGSWSIFVLIFRCDVSVVWGQTTHALCFLIILFSLFLISYQFFFRISNLASLRAVSSRWSCWQRCCSLTQTSVSARRTLWSILSSTPSRSRVTWSTTASSRYVTLSTFCKTIAHRCLLYFHDIDKCSCSLQRCGTFIFIFLNSVFILLHSNWCSKRAATVPSAWTVTPLAAAPLLRCCPCPWTKASKRWASRPSA